MNTYLKFETFELLNSLIRIVFISVLLRLARFDSITPFHSLLTRDSVEISGKLQRRAISRRSSGGNLSIWLEVYC